MKEREVASVNEVRLLGNLGRDPEVRHTNNGTAIATVNLATSRRWKEGDDVREATDWHRVVAFGRTAEVIGEYTQKGSQLYVEGRLQTRSYRDREDQKKYVTEIVARRIQLLGRPQDQKAPSGGEEPPAPATEPEPEGPTEDDIPF